MKAIEKEGGIVFSAKFQNMETILLQLAVNEFSLKAEHWKKKF